MVFFKPFSEIINTKTHESSATFSKDGKTMYFNRTNDVQVQVGEEKFASVKLFKAVFENNAWTNVTELPFSSDQFSTQHPMLSPDEKKKLENDALIKCLNLLIEHLLQKKDYLKLKSIELLFVKGVSNLEAANILGIEQSLPVLIWKTLWLVER